MQDTLLLALYALLLIRNSRRGRRRYRRCIKCNPNAIVRPLRSGSESSNNESDGSSTDGECDCDSNNISLYTDEESEEESDCKEIIETALQKVSAEPSVAPTRARPPLHDNQNVIVESAATRETMRRYPAAPQDAPFKYLVRDVNTGAQPSPPAGTGESYGRHMAEIEYWVKTHRPPCTYGMAPPPSQTDAAAATPEKPVAVARVTERQDAGIKRPIDPDVSPGKNARKKLFTGEEESVVQRKNKFFTTTDEQRRASKTNGSCVQNATSDSKKTAVANGDVSSESTKKSRGRPTSTPITNRTKNLDSGKKASSVANDPPLRTRSGSKVHVKRDADVPESPGMSAGPSRDVKPDNDSDTSILTAPYIRSTRNSASKTKCQTLSRQRASHGKANKSLAKRSVAKADDSIDKNLLDTSLDTKESSAANVSKITSDSSFDIFCPDLTKESANSRRKTLRASCVKKLPTLDFSSTKVPAAAKRTSDPIVTRMSAKRALMSNSCKLGASVEANEEQNGFNKRVGSAPCVSRTDKRKANGGEESPSRRKFFL